MSTGKFGYIPTVYRRLPVLQVLYNVQYEYRYRYSYTCLYTVDYSYLYRYAQSAGILWYE